MKILDEIWYLESAVKVKGKVVPVLYLTEHHAMEAYWGVEVYLHTFLTLAVGGGE
jgi:hypothetical protein